VPKTRKSKHLIDGIEVPTVTEPGNIVGNKFPLMLWYGKNGIAECNRVKEESGKFGQRVHDLVQTYLETGERPSSETRADQCASLIVGWCDEAQVKPLNIEGELESREYMYVGHPDLITTFGDDTRPWVVDWKTSNHIDDYYPLQLSAYAQAYKEMTGQVVDDGAIVRVSKDPNAKVQMEIVEYHNLMTDYFPLFKMARELYDYFNHKQRWSKKLKV